MASPHSFIKIVGDRARRYVDMQSGEILSRRQFDQRYGRIAGLTNEAQQKANAIATGGRARTIKKPTGKIVTVGPIKSVQRAKSYAQEHKISTREAQKSEGFKQLERDLRAPVDGPESAAKKLRAAEAIYGRKAARQTYQSLATYVRKYA